MAIGCLRFSWLEASGSTCLCNIGSEDQVGAREIADIVCDQMEVRPRYILASEIDGGRGRLGELKKMPLDARKIKTLDWKRRTTVK